VTDGPDEVCVTLSGVGIRYRGGPPVLHGVSLQVTSGRPAVVLGANGSGKSTLLRVVAGCAPAGSGRVSGRPRTVGYVPDRFPSQLRMPASSYLRHMAALHRTDPDTAVRDAGDLLDELGFTGGLAVPMAQLSKGNAQKVALAQALCSRAALLVLDEPWSGLDVHGASAVTGRIAAAAAAGAAVLVTDHTHTATSLPRHQLWELVGGRLQPGASRPHGLPPGAAATVITLLTADPQRMVPRLPAHAPFTVARDRITVHVPVGQRDAFLATALALGCGVHAVDPAHAPDRTR
jgi:ABC-2 type transport system ATP-binding protein